MLSRHSVRAFSDRPVPRETVERLLGLAARSASNSNSQPWHVYVLTGEPKDRLTDALWAALDAGRSATDPRYGYQPKPGTWMEPFGSRRSDFGRGLYQDTLGISRDDRDGRAAHHRRNYAFFAAPVGLIIAVSADMGAGAFVDAGLFLQALMLLARTEGLDTCAQASFVDFDPVIRGELSIPDDRIIVCGMSLGYADDTERVNAFRSDREPLDAVVTFVGE